MGKNFQPNFSLYLQEDTLISMAKIINQVMSEYLAKFSAELAEIENVTRTAARKIQKKISSYDVTKIKLDRLYVNTGEVIAANLNENFVVSVEIAEVDKENVIEFGEKVFKTIGGNSYEITRTNNSITVTTGEKKLSQKFEDAGTAEKVEALIDDAILQVEKQAMKQEILISQ